MTRDMVPNWSLPSGTAELSLDMVVADPYNGDTTVWIDAVELLWT